MDNVYESIIIIITIQQRTTKATLECITNQ